uniref:C2 domain-containing protein n=1 Tax=Hemiselmis andersenii TaxID=464988 RepID=A0A7S1GWQ1_HEMAN|mmetsp:Transcript_19896/g.47983  ORF Transcript_19896/g.47983 Transcript_19896/m.47983 type:complete len:979 (+) Transcript_19896:86-3022(+)
MSFEDEKPYDGTFDRLDSNASDDVEDDDVFEGFREFKWENGDFFRGEWDNGQMHGKGKFLCANGTYQGEFFFHQMHGHGRFDFKGGGSYYGMYNQGKREGHGLMAYPDSSVYEGGWEDNKRHGKGTIQYDNFDVYEGDWVEDERTGTGVYVSKMRTEIFKGEFENNKRVGSGEMWVEDPDIKDFFHRYLVDYNDGRLMRKRPRPASDVPWPADDPAGTWEDVKYKAIDTGEKDFQAKQAAEAKNKKQYGNVQTTKGPNESIDSDDGFFNLAGGRRASPDGRPGTNDARHHTGSSGHEGLDRQDTFAQVEDTDFETRSKLMQFLCCGAGKNAVSVPTEGARHGKPDGPSKTVGPGGRVYKVESLVVVRVFKAMNLPAANKDGTTDSFVAARIGSEQQVSEVEKGTVNPTFNKKFEFEFKMEGKNRSVILRVHRVTKIGVEIVGKVVIPLEDQTLGYRSEMKNYFLTSEDGNKPIMGRNDKGAKIGSQLRISYEITLVNDALLTVYVEKATKLRGVDPSTFSSPYLKLTFNDVVLQTKPAKRNYENPVYESYHSFDTHSLDAIRRLSRPSKIAPSKLLVEAWEYFLFGSHVFIGAVEVDMAQLKFGRGDIKLNTYEFKDPDRPKKAIGDVSLSLSWGSNDMTNLRVTIEEGLDLPDCAYGQKPKIMKTNRSPEPLQLMIDSCVNVILDPSTGHSAKTKVHKQSSNPSYQETLWFSIRQNELPAFLTVEVDDVRNTPIGVKHTPVGKALVDMKQLKLDGMPQIRWCRLDHEDLLAAQAELERREERDRAMLRAMQRGQDFQMEGDDDEDEDDKEIKSKGGVKAMLFGAKKMFIKRETAASREKKKLNADIKAIKGGVDPSKQGRVKVSIQWLTVPDEDDIAVQAMWDQAMMDPKNRKVVKRLVQSWSKEIMKRGFETLHRSGEASKRDKEKASTFYLERQLPRHWKAWAKRLKGRQASAKMAKYWNMRNRTEPSFWVRCLD